MSDSLVVACAECASLNRVPIAKRLQQPRCGRCSQPVFGRAPVVLNQLNFDAHVKRSELTAIIDFWAPWCGPCVQFAPIFAEAASSLESRLRLLKLDTEAFPQLAQQFSIRSIPTLVAIRQGQELGRVSGAMPLQTFVNWAAQWS